MPIIAQGMDPEAATERPYRAPGRVLEAERHPVPARVLLAPLVKVSLSGLVIVFALGGINFLQRASDSGRWIPAIDRAQDALEVGLLLGLPWMFWLIFQLVRPRWQHFGAMRKIAYVTGMATAQLLVLAGLAGALLMSRGGIPLFEPRYESTFRGPEGKTAYLYRGGLFCSVQVFTSKPYGLTMQGATSVSRKTCNEPKPKIVWKPDGSVMVVDAQGKPLESQDSLFNFFLGGGC
jgi:hypothetical protein